MNNTTQPQITTEKLKERIYKLPIQSDLYNVYKRMLEERLLEEKNHYNTPILCFDSIYKNVNNVNKKIKNSIIKDHNPLTHLDSNDSLYSIFETEKNSMICDNEYLTFVPRYRAEYNPELVQVTVAGYVTDIHDDSFVFLNCKHGRMNNNITMVQGHVDYDSSAHELSLHRYLELNILRELDEELSIEGLGPVRNGSLISVEPKFIISTNTNNVDKEHIGIVYDIKIDSKGKNITTLETEKHEVLKCNKRFANTILNLDSWLSVLIETKSI